MAGTSTEYLVDLLRCPACGRGFVASRPLVLLSCPCGTQVCLTGTWDLSVSGIPDMHVVPRVQVQQ